MTVWGNGSATRPTVSHGGEYGAARGPTRKHAGSDFIGYSELRAIEGGTVTEARLRPGAAGITIAIDLDQKLEGCTVTVVRMHVKSGTVRVARGDHVDAGQFIGMMGMTGNEKNGVCDHVEIRYWRGRRLVKTVDPVKWIGKRVGASPAVEKAADIRVRTTIEPSNGRVEPRRNAVLIRVLPRGTDHIFVAFTHGERVEGNDVWFRGRSGLWYWSGGFGSHSTAGLKEL